MDRYQSKATTDAVQIPTGWILCNMSLRCIASKRGGSTLIPIRQSGGPTIHSPPVRRRLAPPAAGSAAGSAATPPSAQAALERANQNIRTERELTQSSRAVVLEQQLWVGPGTTMVDLGCGRGEVLIDAAELGATLCVGVDFNADVASMLADTIRRRGWTATPMPSIDGDRAWRLSKGERRCTLRFVLGDLRSMPAVPMPRDAQGRVVGWSPGVSVYWYGTIMPQPIKSNVCAQMLASMPPQTRVAFIHLPYGHLDDGFDSNRIKRRGVLFSFGLPRHYRLLRNRCPCVRADCLQTNAGEEAASFLYGKQADDDAFPPPHPTARCEASIEAFSARRLAVLSQRTRGAEQELKALRYLRSLRRGASDAAQAGESSRSDESDDESDDSDRSDASALTKYASDSEPPDPSF